MMEARNENRVFMWSAVEGGQRDEG